MEAPRQRQPVVLVVDPVLPDRVADAEHRSAEHLAAERVRVNHGADVGHREIVDDVVAAGFDVDFDFGERRDERNASRRRADRRRAPRPSGPARRAPSPTPS